MSFYTDSCIILVRAAQVLAQMSDPFRNMEHDIKEARDHAIQLDENFDDYDFKITKYPSFPVKKIYEYDDPYAWTEFHLGELKEDPTSLEAFRGKQWADKAQQWLNDGIPAIVIVDTPEFTGVADGRGRVNFAIGMGIKTLPVIMMKANRLPHQSTYNVRT